jgi:DNA-binding response OmpR family regulator
VSSIVFGTARRRRVALSRDDTLRLNFHSHDLTRFGRRIFLSSDEFSVIALLCAARLATYDQLYEILWGDDPEGGPLTAQRTFWNLKARLCSKLGCVGLSIETMWGVGLVLRIAPAAIAEAA